MAQHAHFSRGRGLPHTLEIVWPRPSRPHPYIIPVPGPSPATIVRSTAPDAQATALPPAHAHVPLYPIQIAGRIHEDDGDHASSESFIPSHAVSHVPPRDHLPSAYAPSRPPSTQFALLAAGAASLDHPNSKRKKEIDSACEFIRLEHRKPRTGRAPDFRTDADRNDYRVDSEIDALVPLLPYQAVSCMLGGEQGWRQVPRGRRDRLLRRMLKQRAGSEGDRLASVRHLLRDIRMYAVRYLGVSRADADEASFPMSSAMSHELIAIGHEKATHKGQGSKGGATVGHHLRETLIFAAEKLLWPIEVPRVVLDCAAPKAHILPRDRAGTLPIAAKCQLEIIARGQWGMVTVTDPSRPHEPFTQSILDLNQIPRRARKAVVFYARSILVGGIDHSVRIAEGVRVDLWPDEHDPTGVIRGQASIGKDGAPVDIYAPAEGFLGKYEWYPQHLVECHEGGIVFPKWRKPHGSGGDIALSEGTCDAVAERSEIREAFKSLLRMKPLAYTDAELSEMNIQGHSAHASFPDWARALGENIVLPSVRYLHPALARGFTEPDLDLLGHWLRSAEIKDQARAAAAAASAPPGMARRAAAIVQVKARARTAHKMHNYYGTGGATANRFSERIRQLSARQRLVHVIQIALDNRIWHALPRGQLDILHLLASPSGDTHGR